MKRTADDIIVGLERLSAMITVFGTFASWHKCENTDSVVTPMVMNNAYDMMADYAEMLEEQLTDIEYPHLKDVKQIG